VAVALACGADRINAPPNVSYHEPAVAAGLAKGHEGDALPASLRAKAKIYCSGSSCFAAAFDFKDFPKDATSPGPYTVMTAYFQDLQGTFPPDGPSTPLAIDGLHFQCPASGVVGSYVDVPTGGLPILPIGNVQIGLVASWPHDGAVDPGDGNGNSDSWTGVPAGEIYGCDLWPGNPPGHFSVQTCPSQGLDGWAKVEFVLRRFVNWELTKPPVRFEDFRFLFGATQSTGGSCTIGGNLPGTCTDLPYRSVFGPNGAR
jgi:hypothetical protein